MGIEKRRYKRVILKRQVLINGSIKAQGLDLSLGGLYVHTGRNFPMGSDLNVTLPLITEIINVRARVRNAQESVGMGVEFRELTQAQEAAIQDFVNSAMQASSGNAKKTVLIVDDNASLRRMNRSRLVLDGYSVLEAEDGIKALDMLEKEKIDLVVLDLYMERLDGYKVLSIMRQKPEWKDLPVLVFSARSSADEVDMALSAGATEFLVKMMTSPVKLSQRVKMYLSGSQ
jgi:PleD family two-component response regulator